MTFTPEGIIVHCSATPPGWMEGQTIQEKRNEIALWHTRDRGWRAIGYAQLIDRDGQTAIGRDLDKDGDPFDEIGAHTLGWNSKAIGLCLIGGHASAATDKFADHFTPEQDAQLRQEIATLQARFPSIKWVKGHNEFANKACPGFNVGRWLNNKPPRSKAASTTLIAAAGGSTGLLGAIGGVIGGLDPTAQIVLVAGVLLALGAFGWIARERLKKWARGVE